MRDPAETAAPAGQQIRQIGLAERIARWTGTLNRLDTEIQGLTLHRFDAPTEPTSYTLAPSVCLIGQGRKRVFLGEQAYVYDAHHFLINSVDLPLVAQIIEASRDRPYLGLTLELDVKAIARLMLDRSLSAPRAPQPDRLGIAVSGVSPALLDAFERLIDLMDQPEDIPALAPLIRQEIYYRLLVSEQATRLRQIASVESHSFQIAQAIDWLKCNFDKTLRVEDLAAKAGMSSSSFHHHFRSTTAMSPIQYQKRLRLNQARQLMLTEHIDAAAAAFQVGYESPSQFSREYSRLFGAPPMRDMRKLQAVPVEQAQS